jgi:alkanesulfonate monooxygenase SsuD/methylene tetrahydromethanopterin reductase-like flavin-dependent oxidoreductase (luciferase family)
VSAVLDRIGLSLWTMQSTAAAPASTPALYRRFAAEAELAEQLGFHSVWLAEHRAWYDGWCPAPLHAAAAAAARTERLRFGTAMLLLPQHDPRALVATARTFDRLSGGRLELGVGLGYRDAEFDALGLRRDRRGKTMDRNLDELVAGWPAPDDGRRPWVGGMAPAAIARAARHGCGLMLPQTLSPEALAETIASYRAEAADPGPIGMTKDVCVEPDSRRADDFRAALRRHFTEEIGSWWALRGKLGFEQPEGLERQLTRIDESALVGPAAAVAEALDEAYAAGVDFLLLRIAFDFVGPDELRRQMRSVAEDVAPLLAAQAATR